MSHQPSAMSHTHLRTLVVIPAYNEQGKIDRVIQKIPAGLVSDTLVVDDCSRDATACEARKAGALVVQHAHNLGVGAAIRSGIDYAIANGYDVVAILSGNDPHYPNYLRQMLGFIQCEGYDVGRG